MENKIILNNLEVKENRILYDYIILGDWKKYFIDTPFFIEYEENIETVPKSILSIPFLGNILPMSWVFNATVIVDEIDEDFYNCLNNVKKGYEKMYPQIEFKGNLETRKIIKNKNDEYNNNIVLFSGGLDAYSTLITHINEKPILATIWGADINVYDDKRWENIKKWIKNEATSQELRNTVIKTSFREIINEEEIDRCIKKIVGDGWWHGFQHGLALITHLAPECYINNVKTIYIASSFTKEYHEVCASDPSIDNFVKIGGSGVVHDGYEFDQGDKIRNVGEYVKKSKKKIKLRVCLAPNSVENCCKCEKCYRRIVAILAEGYDPNEFGFNCNNNTYKRMHHDFKYKIILRHTKNWKTIQKNLKKNEDKFKQDWRVNWILDFDFDKNNRNLIKEINRCKKGLLRRIKKIGKKR